MDNRLGHRVEAMLDAFRTGNPNDLKRIGNDAISDAVLGNSQSLAEVSVVSYALYKMITKNHFVDSPRWQKVSEKICASLEKCMQCLGQGDEESSRRSLKSAIEKIEEIDSELSNFARGIYEKAKIRQASTAYAMGMTLRQAAELTNADRNELQRYIGITRIHDEQPPTMGIAERLRVLKEALGK